METQLVAEFVSKTRASPNDALSCLRTWGWDLKKALIDYNGKLHQYISKFKVRDSNHFIDNILQVHTLECWE